jgi:signal transduction histidine kinase
VLGLLGAGKIGGIDEESRQLVQLAVRNADRLSRLINSIVDMQRMESGQMRLQQSFVGAHELVRRTNQRVREMADEAGVKLKYVVQNMQLQVDLERVVQVLDNLIQNAVKYSAPGQTVTVSALRGPEVVLFSVKDQGPGIAAEMQPRIFERFFQGDSTDARNKGGTGLGLTIARGIVQRHGGKIWVESREGEGATFFVELPQRRKRKAEKTPGL